ncbi:MAG: glycosyltransferase family 4 protein [Thiotrichales bacterium]|jgi:glycosyltransferase involved in cell wall biosynthesis|nr:glycosyltransferase family 4 protein [Thiotrichales bacterium]
MSAINKPKILTLISFYKPSFKAGGPVKTIANMVDQLKSLKFSVFTRDRDLGDAQPFKGIEFNHWQQVEGAVVLYATQDKLSVKYIAETIQKEQFDVLYLNSFFDPIFTIKPLIARKLGLIKVCPIVLAPRGEFSPGALAIKSFKKKLFIKFASLLGLYDNIIWQASSEFEKQDIIQRLKVPPSTVFIAKDLPPKLSVSTVTPTLNANETCKVIFLSRISPIKNLDFALEVLKKVQAHVFFDIYGPIEDDEYWQACLKLIKQLPSNIQVNYCGSVTSDQVVDVFSSYDLFFFPTRGENYGHVIAESLAAGTPVLLSDQTPWQDLARDNLGWDLSLEMDSFVAKIEEVAQMDSHARIVWRQQVALNSVSKINNEQDIADNMALFQFALDRFKKAK